MMRYSGNTRRIGALIIPMLSMFVAINVDANEDPAFAPELAIGLGVGDVFDDSPDAGFGIEYRYAPIWRDLRPAVGYNTTTEDDWYVYAGFRYFFWLSDTWRFDPTIAVGYFDPGDGIELGGSIEFRSGFEFSRRLSERTRLALGFAHLSNARLYRSNPGTETVSLSISIAL